MQAWVDTVRELLSRLTLGQKLQIAVAALATLGLIWGMVVYAGRVRYDVLFSGVDVDDTAAIVAALRERNVDYRLTRGGQVIEVPVGQVDDLRLELAGEQLPRGGGVGFELFDQPSFGVSAFVQDINYQRALERELGRSIAGIDDVESARVHLALPPESVFADERREPTASVFLRMRGNRTLPAERVRAIAHLVASGVEELDASQVSVIDGHGRMLSEPDADGDAGLSSAHVEQRHALEQRLESRLVEILEPVVGRGKVRARANVELETARVQRVEERFDPDSVVVRSEQKNKSKQRGAGPGGVPGTDSNLPGGTAPGAGAGSDSETTASTTNFEINKTVSTIAEPRGRLLRQSVAVVVDHATRSVENEQGETTTETVPRTTEEMQKITDLVRAAVGLDERRGDVINVENIAFDVSLESVADAPPGTDWVGLILPILRYLALPLAALLLALLVIRPGIAALRGALVATAATPELTAVPTVAQLQAQIAEGRLPQPPGQSPLRQKLIEAAVQDPAAAALVIREWFGASTES